MFHKIAPLFVLFVACLPGAGSLRGTTRSPIEDGGVLIFGGTRNTGLEVAKHLRARGEIVTVFRQARLRPVGTRTAGCPLCRR